MVSTCFNQNFVVRIPWEIIIQSNMSEGKNFPSLLIRLEAMVGWRLSAYLLGSAKQPISICSTSSPIGVQKGVGCWITRVSSRSSCFAKVATFTVSVRPLQNQVSTENISPLFGPKPKNFGGTTKTLVLLFKLEIAAMRTMKPQNRHRPVCHPSNR